MYQEKLLTNPLLSKADAQQALLDLVVPLEKYFKTSKYGIRIDSSGSVYEEKTREIEAVLRPLWGLIPFLLGGGTYPFIDQYLDKIRSGVDPKSESYWDEIGDTDQLMVEMAILGTGLCLAKERFWDELSSKEQENLHRWLIKINDHDMPENNWRFFRILVNLGLKNCDAAYSEAQIQKDLADIDSYYIESGWYADGNPNQIDYYVPFAMHYYSLIYVKVVKETDQIYAPKFKERAVRFALDFKSFFNTDGAAVAYGRSMAYRFAQSAFWGALAFAEVEALPWGEIKHLCLQNLRYWFKQDIFAQTGELTIGYRYRNLVMAEGYNAYGSPYWALKTFIFLTLPDEHPFWQAEETIPEVDKQLLIPAARSIICRDEAGLEIQLFPTGQHCEFMPAHAEAKYEKFVYSTTFGFSVAKGAIGLGQGAFDNTLAVSEQDRYYRMRYSSSFYQVEENYLSSLWQPWEDVTIKSYIVPLFPWHVRFHFIQTNRKLSLADGGFSADAEGKFDVLTLECALAYKRANGDISGVVNLLSFDKQELIYPEPNTNLNYPRSVLPTLMRKVEPGTYVLASAILGAVGKNAIEWWEKVPTITSDEKRYTIEYLDKLVHIPK